MTWSARPVVADTVDHGGGIDLLPGTMEMVERRVGDQDQAGWHLDLVTMRIIVGKIWVDEIEKQGLCRQAPATSTTSCPFSTHLRLLSSLWISLSETDMF